jgi:hypothetical protein
MLAYRCWSKVKRCWLIDVEKAEKSLNMLKNRLQKSIRYRAILKKFGFF